MPPARSRARAATCLRASSPSRGSSGLRRTRSQASSLRFASRRPRSSSRTRRAGLLAALAIGLEALVAAALLLQLKTLLDNADGRLARATGRATLFGRYLDTEADLLVNAALFVALGTVTEPWLALASFLALTLVLSADFNATELYRAAHGVPSASPMTTGSTAERAAAGVYRILFAPQDRLLRGALNARLERVLRNEHDAGWRAETTRAYHDRATLVVLANLGLSTQLVVLGVCLAAGAPEAYLWLVLVQAAALPLLQLRRERLARRALRLRRGA